MNDIAGPFHWRGVTGAIICNPRPVAVDILVTSAGRSAGRDGAYPSPGAMTQDAPAAPRPVPSEPGETHTGRLNRYVPRALLEHLAETPERSVRSEDGT